MSTVTCPYCEAELGVCQDDGFCVEDSTDYDMECEHCDKTFIITPCISWSFDARKADCKNGDAEHKLEDKIGYPEAYYVGIKCCTDCGESFSTKEEERDLAIKVYMDELNNKRSKEND